MNFRFTPKTDGKPLNVETFFTGRLKEALKEARHLGTELERLFPGKKFTVQLDRIRGPKAISYEVPSDRHTAETD